MVASSIALEAKSADKLDKDEREAPAGLEDDEQGDSGSLQGAAGFFLEKDSWEESREGGKSRVGWRCGEAIEGVEVYEDEAEPGCALRAWSDVGFCAGSWGDLACCCGGLALLLYAGCRLRCSITNLTACHVFAVQLATAAWYSRVALSLSNACLSGRLP